MAHSILNNFHKPYEAYKQDLSKGKRVYLQASDVHSCIMKSNKKRMPLFEVFKKSKDYLKKDVRPAESSIELGMQVTHIGWLLKDNEEIITHYRHKTDTWCRTFLKKINSYAPKILKYFLPGFFSNKIEESEQKTEKEYGRYITYLKRLEKDLNLARTAAEARERIAILNKNNPVAGVAKLPELAVRKEMPEQYLADIADLVLPKDLIDIQFGVEKTPQHVRKADNPKVEFAMKPPGKAKKEEGPIPKELLDADLVDKSKLPPVPKAIPKAEAANPQPVREEQPKRPTAEPMKKEDPKAVVKEEGIPKIAKPARVTSARDSTLEATRSINTCVKLLQTPVDQPLDLYQLTKIHRKLSLSIQLFLQLQSKATLERYFDNLDITKELLDVLLGDAYKKTISENDTQALAEILTPTELGTSINNVLDAYDPTELFMRKLGGMETFRGKNRSGEKNEKHFDNFNGSLSVTPQSFKHVKNLLNLKPDCRPNLLEIRFNKEDALTKEVIQEISALKEKIPVMIFAGIEKIDLQEMGLSEADEANFLKYLTVCDCPDLQSLVLSKNKDSLTPDDLNHLLEAYPNQKLLKQCFQLTSTPSELNIPLALLSQKKWDFDKENTIEDISYLIGKLPCIESLTIDHSGLTDLRLKLWIEQRSFNRLYVLNLTGCENLTTDSLSDLYQINSLWNLVLPATIHPGTGIQLPSTSNPFLAFSNVLPESTRSFTRQIYKGPTEYATLFQIPLAWANEPIVFSEKDEILGPETLQYWLHQNSYEYLQPQEHVKAIFGDRLASINDKNVVEIIKKFPNLLHISLQNCHGITNKGIQAVLDFLPHTKIKSIDVKGCSNITDELFAIADNLQKISTLYHFTISGTAISPEAVTAYKEALNKIVPTRNILVHQPYELKITNEQLGENCEHLEEVLAAQDLSKLVYLNFEGCTSLTDEVLNRVLGRLNVDEVVEDPETQKMIDNPGRLNIAFLNLKGCTNITDKAFQENEEAGKVTNIYAGRLEQVLTQGTQISEPLAAAYPSLIFSSENLIFTPEFDAEAILSECEAYYAKEKAIQERPLEADLINIKKEAAHLIRNRIFLQLFGHLCKNRQSVEEILAIPLDVFQPNLADMQITFMTNDSPQAQVTTFNTSKSILYSQSAYFRGKFSPGCEAAKEAQVNLINQNATPEAAQKVLDLLNGKDILDGMDWNLAVKVAELISPRCLRFPLHYYHQLLTYIHSQFDFAQAHEMLTATVQLEDTEGFNRYEEELLAILKADKTTASQMAGFARSFAKRPFSLDRLQIESNKILAQQVERALRLQQNREDARKSEEAIRRLIEADQE